MTVKHQLRTLMKRRRAQISPARRLQAQKRALAQITLITKKAPLILSYSSVGTELSLNPLNELLARSGQLVLPRVNGSTLDLYRVTAQSQLKQSTWGIFEPDPPLAEPVYPQDLSLCLIPGLAFDTHNQRLGYGKGFYDRLLSSLPKRIPTIGIGFVEQMAETSLPAEYIDIPLDLLILR